MEVYKVENKYLKLFVFFLYYSSLFGVVKLLGDILEINVF